MILNTNHSWCPGRIIRVKFLDGENTHKALVKEWSKEILQHTNIIFFWVPDDASGYAYNSDIFISFRGMHANSNVGTQCFQTPLPQATMNLGQVRISLERADEYFESDISTEEYRRTLYDFYRSDARADVLHEFCHMLGFEHEQAHPYSTINWNPNWEGPFKPNPDGSQSSERYTYRDYIKYEADGYDASFDYDPNSIMHYSAQAYQKRVINEALDGPLNKPLELTNTDIASLKAAYPRTTKTGRLPATYGEQVSEGTQPMRDHTFNPQLVASTPSDAQPLSTPPPPPSQYISGLNGASKT